MYVACLWSHWQEGNEELDSFAAITDEPPPEIAAAGHDRAHRGSNRSVAMTLSTLIVIVGFAFLVPVVTAAVLWKRLNRKWLFLMVSLLSIVAVADLSLSVFRDWLVPAMPDTLPSDLPNFNIELARQNQMAMVLVDAVVLIVDVPLLGWLFAALRKSPRTIAIG